MMRLPTRTTIDAAELKVAQSSQATLNHLRLARTRSQELLARPQTMILGLGAAGVFGFFLARRQQKNKSANDQTAIKKAPSGLGLMLAFIVRYGWQYSPFILQQLQSKLPNCAIPQSQGIPESQPTATVASSTST